MILDYFGEHEREIILGICEENKRLHNILKAVWIEGMQDGLPDDLRSKIDAEVGDECRKSLPKYSGE
jgi:hypothetical protein